MPSNPNFLSTIDESLIIRLYGTKIQDLSIVAPSHSPLVTGYGATSVSFAWIHGAKVLGICRQLPSPLLVIVPDPDSDPEGCEVFSDPRTSLINV